MQEEPLNLSSQQESSSDVFSSENKNQVADLSLIQNFKTSDKIKAFRTFNEIGYKHAISQPSRVKLNSQQNRKDDEAISLAQDHNQKATLTNFEDQQDPRESQRSLKGLVDQVPTKVAPLLFKAYMKKCDCVNKVLIAEDNNYNIYVLTSMLDELGIRYDHAING